MDALKKAETDKQKQDQTDSTAAAIDNEPAESLSLELSDHPDEFNDLPESDVVDDPQIQPEVAPQASLQLEQPEPVQQQEQPRIATTLARIKKNHSRQRYYLIAAAMSLVAILVSGYFFWRLNSITYPAVKTSQGVDEQNLQISGVPVTTTPAVAPEKAAAAVVPTARIKRAAPISQESFISPDPEPAAIEKPIKIKKHSASKNNSRTLLQAYQAYTRGDYQTARTLYEKLLTRLPRNRDARLGLAAIALKKGDNNRAKYHYRQILELNPMDPAARTALAGLDNAGDIDRDASEIKHWLQTNRNDAAMQFVLGNRYALAEQWSKAQQAYFQAYENSPENADYAFNLAISLEQLNKPDLAIKYYHIARQNASINQANFNTDILNRRIKLLESRPAGAS